MLSKAQLKRFSSLKHKKNRIREGLFMVQGRKAFHDAAPYFELVATIEAPSEIVKVTTLDASPDIIGIFRIPDETPPLKIEDNEFAVVLDGIQDPGNLGTIIRTAHWFGVKKIFCSPDTVDVYNPKVVQATMGSIAKVGVTYVPLEDLFHQNPGKPVYGLLLEGEDIFTIESLKPGFILMGSEGHGPSMKVKRLINVPLTIPPKDSNNHPDSLNVATATAITLSQLLK